MIIAQGGAFGGFALYAKDGRPAYCYNLFGLQQFKVYGEDADPRGRAPGADGVHLRRRRTRARAATSSSTSTASRSARDASRTPSRCSSRPTRRRDVGSDTATPVSDDYGPTDSEFNGNVQWVQLDIDDAAEDEDHVIGPEELFRVAMARQ